jgi:hypothetical protein
MVSTINKKIFDNYDPDAKKPYFIDWTAYLASPLVDTIATSTWSATPTGLTLYDASEASGVTSVWISGGKAGKTYQVTNHIVTTTYGIEDDRTFVLVCQER